jgi:ABC-type multidrug transport system fused ATPase/permease subunit
MDGGGGVRSLCAAADIRAADAGCDKPPRRRARVDFATARRKCSRYACSIGRTRQVRIDRVLQLNIGIYKFKFSMNFLMNICSHLQVVAALLIGGWVVHTDQLEVGGVVAFISGAGRLNDPWGDLVN